MTDFGETTDPIDVPVEDAEVIEIPEEDAPVVDGQAEGSGDAEGVDVFNVDDYGDREVTVKVGGEEVKVPLREALSGYQRQADYTRKTQELSRAQAMMEALEANPQATLQFLASQYGTNSPEYREAQAEVEDDGFDSDDPVAQTVRAMRSELEELRSYQTEQVLDRTLSQMQAKYGDDFNQQEVIQAAAQRQITHPSELEGVFRDLMFDKFYATAKAREEATDTANAEKVAREQAKAQLANTVSSGNGAANSSAGSTPDSFDSIEDAFEAAARQLGVTF